MRGMLILLGLSFCLSSGSVSAAEVSLMSGLYKQEKKKSEGDSTGEKTEIEIGGRYADDYDIDMTWFGQGLMTMRSYDEPKDGKSPSNSTSLALGGGLRLYFDSFSEAVSPFAYGLLQYVNDKDAEFLGLGYRETENNGLFYSMHTGFRFRYDQVLFVDLELPIFMSALTATTTTETESIATDGTESSSKEERTRTELYVDSQEPFSSLTVVFGMKI